MQQLDIKSDGGNYSVIFLKHVNEVIATIEKIPSAVFVIDERVKSLYPALANFLKDKKHLELPATEEAKTWEGVGKVISWYQDSNCVKSTTVVAIGGGIIQDIVCFSSSVFYRGINWQFVPTTVLSMSDSCIGAKCGINVNQFKNQVGAFHSPKGVYICSEFTKTLDDKDVQSGYGEILKLLLTGAKPGFDKLQKALAGEGVRGSSLLELIRDSLEVKKTVIEKDEYELDLRRILNYGHTLGHSLETISNHEVPHGLAVAWGIDIINFLSWKLNYTSEEDFLTIHRLIKDHLAFEMKSKVTAEQLLNGARRDKKAAGGFVHFILFGGYGDLRIVKTPFDNDLEKLVDQYIREYNVFSSH